MELSSAKRTLGKVAAILGIIQGAAWTLMSLVAIIVHYWEPSIGPVITYENIIGSILYHKFIVDYDTEVLGISFIITPTNFSIFMWVYFMISVLWCSLSFDQFTAIHYNKNRQAIVTRVWGMTTLILSAIDIAFVVFLAIDYAACAEERSESSGLTQNEYFCYLSTGIMMTIAARGFTLLLINIAFSIIMLMDSTEEIEEEEYVSNESLYSTIPRAKLASIPVYQRF